MRIHWALLPAMLMAAVAIAASETAPSSPVRELKIDEFEGGKFTDVMKPAEIKSAEELEKAVPDKAIREAVAKQVDFAKDVVVLFHWMGSGGDRVDAGSAGSGEAQRVTFSVLRGTTKDLRTHLKAYAVTKDVKWTVQTGR